VKNGIVEAADELLKANAPLSRVHPRTGHDILHMACDSGQYQLVDLIVEHGKKRQIDVVSSTTLQFEMTCLHLAAMNGRNGIAHLMLEAGTDVNALDWEGESALLKFARQVYGGGTAQAGLFARFMEKGADPNVRDKDGHTALFYAIDHNQPAATKILVEGGADTATVSTKVDQTTGQTVDVGAFEMAVSSGAREVAAWLVTSGRREKFTYTSLKGSRGGALSPLYAVVLQGWRDVALAMLKDGGATEDVNAPNKDGSTALFVASQKGLDEVVSALLEAGRRWMRRTTSGRLRCSWRPTPATARSWCRCSRRGPTPTRRTSNTTRRCSAPRRRGTWLSLPPSSMVVQTRTRKVTSRTMVAGKREWRN
jgi:hypothetical protein